MRAVQQTYNLDEKLQQHRSHPTSDIVPRAMIRPEALSYQLLRPNAAGPADMALLGEAYRCWSTVWAETLLELDNVKKVASDDFTRQDEIGAIFHEWECIGMTSYRWVDLSSAIDRSDSYFSVWPADALDSAAAYGSKVCLCSNLTVAAPWRRAGGYSVKEMLLALAVERFKQTDGDALLGTPRNDKGMNELGYRLGFRPLHHGVAHHGVEIDLVAFYRNSCARLSLAPATESVIQALLPRNEEEAK